MVSRLGRMLMVMEMGAWNVSIPVPAIQSKVDRSQAFAQPLTTH